MTKYEPGDLRRLFDPECKAEREHLYRMRHAVLPELAGKLWHTTQPERFERILQSGAILPEPDIPDKDRWKTAAGPEHYPYVRILGGVSLFDFRDFQPESYTERYSLSSWHEFVPYQESCGRAVWIEIHRHKLASQFVSGADL